MAWWSAVVVHRTDFTSDALTNEFSCFCLSLKSKKGSFSFSFIFWIDGAQVKRGEQAQAGRRRRQRRQNVVGETKNVDDVSVVAHRRQRRQTMPMKWPPDFPPTNVDLVFSPSSPSLASSSTSLTFSVPAPQIGSQTRDVRCRGQDGEELPLRQENKSWFFLILLPLSLIVPLSLSLTHTLSHVHSLSHKEQAYTHTLSCSLVPLSLSHVHSLWHKYTLSHSIFLFYAHALSISLPLSLPPSLSSTLSKSSSLSNAWISHNFLFLSQPLTMFLFHWFSPSSSSLAQKIFFRPANSWLSWN